MRGLVTRLWLVGVVAFSFGAAWLIGAQTAQAEFVAPGTGACSDAAPPPGQAGGYYWVASDGTCSDDWISQDEFSSLVDQQVAAGDEAIGESVPSDTAASDAEAGTSLWDSLSTARMALKNNAFNVLTKLGDWPEVTAMGDVPLLAAGASGYIGWKIGKAIDSVLGIGQDSNSEGISGHNTWASDGLIYPCHAGGYLELNRQCTPTDTYGTGLRVPADSLVATFSCSGNYCPSPNPWVFYDPPGSDCTEPYVGLGYQPGTLNNVPANATLLLGNESAEWNGFVCRWGAYLEPFDQGALPGPNQGAPASYSATVTSTWTPPDEATQKSNAASALQSRGFDEFTQYECGKGGPSGPCPFWTVVPDPTVNESAASYSDRLTQLGLQSNLVTLPAPQADWSTAAGRVVYTRPTSGSSVDPGSSVDAYVNPDPMPDPTETGEKDERSCDRSTPDYVPQSQQDPTGFTAVSDPELVESSTFTTTRGPTVLNYGYAEARVDDDLDFGGWGYWHIRAGHGWSLADDADTRIALEDPTPIPATDRKGVDPYEFHGPKYPGKGGAVCRRVVLVDFGTTAGDPGPKGIITSYGADVNTLRVGYR